MEITREPRGGVVVLRLSGRLDASTAQAASEAFDAELDAGRGVLVSLSALEYVSSAGLRVLLKAAKRARGEGIGFCLSGVSGSVGEVFDASGFSALFDIAVDEDEGIGMLTD